jgi:hypothetical protein
MRSSKNRAGEVRLGKDEILTRNGVTYLGASQPSDKGFGA